MGPTPTHNLPPSTPDRGDRLIPPISPSFPDPNNLPSALLYDLAKAWDRILLNCCMTMEGFCTMLIH